MLHRRDRHSKQRLPMQSGRLELGLAPGQEDGRRRRVGPLLAQTRHGRFVRGSFDGGLVPTDGDGRRLDGQFFGATDGARTEQQTPAVW